MPCCHPLALCCRLPSLAIHGREAHAHLGEARDHVLALFLEEAHVGVHASEDVLHAAALLAEVAHEDALLLEKGLVLLELGALLVQAVLRQLNGGIGLLAVLGQQAPALLELAEVVHGEGRREQGELAGEVVVALGLVDLALEGLQLASYLAFDVLGAGEVLLHRPELAL